MRLTADIAPFGALDRSHLGGRNVDRTHGCLMSLMKRAAAPATEKSSSGARALDPLAHEQTKFRCRRSQMQPASGPVNSRHRLSPADLWPEQHRRTGSN